MNVLECMNEFFADLKDAVAESTDDTLKALYSEIDGDIPNHFRFAVVGLGGQAMFMPVPITPYAKGIMLRLQKGCEHEHEG